LNFLFAKEFRKKDASQNIDLFSTLIIIRASNHYIRVISEGSCDTEDWSNDAENSALITGINYILPYIHIDRLK